MKYMMKIYFENQSSMEFQAEVAENETDWLRAVKKEGFITVADQEKKEFSYISLEKAQIMNLTPKKETNE